MKEKVLFIGANDMREISLYQDVYKEGLFIEPIPEVFKELEKNFHLYSTDNLYASSSIFKMHKNEQDRLGYKETIKLQSKRMSNIISLFNLDIKNYDVVIDVQGAELEVLKSFDDHINKIDWLKTEISTTDIYYEGGVLFNELNSFLNEHKLFTKGVAQGHMDLIYEKS